MSINYSNYKKPNKKKVTVELICPPDHSLPGEVNNLAKYIIQNSICYIWYCRNISHDRHQLRQFFDILHSSSLTEKNHASYDLSYHNYYRCNITYIVYRIFQLHESLTITWSLPITICWLIILRQHIHVYRHHHNLDIF